MTKERFDLLLIGMVALAAVVFAALYFVRAGYGLLRDGRWGPKIDNRIGWILMEAPVFLAMTALCLCSPRRNEAAPLVFFALFQLHYLHLGPSSTRCCSRAVARCRWASSPWASYSTC